jgi:hypothetical protein
LGLRRRNGLCFLDNAIVITSAQRLLAPRRVIKRSRAHLFGCIEPPAYAAMQKKVWLRKKNAYLMLARVGVTL